MAIPPEIIESIAVSNAKSIGEQPAILANLALANQIANTNLAQQNAIANQQALFQLQLATISKCVEVISSIDPKSASAVTQLQTYKELMSMILNQSSNTTEKAAKPPPKTKRKPRGGR